MTVEDYYVDGNRIPADKIDPEQENQRKLLRFSILCNDSTNTDGKEIGDPTETALINLGSKLGFDAIDIRNRYHRESRRKRNRGPYRDCTYQPWKQAWI